MKEFPCTYEGCTKTYNQKSRLDIHLRTHEGFKPFKCDVPGCNKTFNENGNLRTHMRSHSGSKPYKCIEIGCSSSFKFSINLKYHLKTHKKNNQSFYCIYCPMTFTRYSTLQTHINIHKEEESKPLSESLLHNKRAQTAEDLIKISHPKESKATKTKNNKNEMKRKLISMNTETDITCGLSLNASDIKDDESESLIDVAHNDMNYFDFQSNLSFLLQFAKSTSNSIQNQETPFSTFNLKMHLGSLLQDHQERVKTFLDAPFKSEKFSL